MEMLRNFRCDPDRYDLRNCTHERQTKRQRAWVACRLGEREIREEREKRKEGVATGRRKRGSGTAMRLVGNSQWLLEHFETQFAC